MPYKNQEAIAHPQHYYVEMSCDLRLRDCADKDVEGVV